MKSNKKELVELLNKYGIKDLSELDICLKQYKYLSENAISCVDIHEYNQLLKDLNRFLKLEHDLGASLEGFVRAFMKGDAMWAYHPEKHVIGEMKVKDPFSQEIHVKRITPENPLSDFDKKKLN